MTEAEEILRKPGAIELVEYELSPALIEQGVQPMLYPRLTDEALAALSVLVEGCIGEDTPHGSGQNTAYEAGIDWRNQMRQEIRNNLKKAGLFARS